MALAFQLTHANEASAPPAERDDVRLLVARRGRQLMHDVFRGLPLQTVVQFIDGKDLFWYGTRTATALDRMSELIGSLA